MFSNVEPVCPVCQPFVQLSAQLIAHMACFLFHPRVIRLSAPLSSRSRFCPHLIPKCALARAKVTKANSKLQILRWPGTLVSVRTRELSTNSSKTSRGSTILKIVKFLFLAGGLVFWTLIGFRIASYATGWRKVNKPQLAPIYTEVFQVDPKDFAQGGSAMKEVIGELTSKQFAIKTLWDRLRNDEAFRRKFGENVLISGYKLIQRDPTGVEAVDSPELFTVDKESNSNRWKVCLHVDGSISCGLVTMVFHKVNTDNIKWIPVSLLIETLPSSGVKVCDISAPLPNGITKFTRLFNDD